MIDLIENISIEFQHDIDEANVCLMEAATTFMESLEYSNYITEASSEPFTVKIKKFFADIIVAIKNFKSSIQIEINKSIRGKEYQAKLRALYKEANIKKNAGIKKIEVMDVWSYTYELERGIGELEVFANRISKMKYKHVKDIDNDTTQFNKLADELNNKLDEIASKKITVKLDKLIPFIEDEISGRSKIFNQLNDAIALFEQMSNDCSTIETRRNILGPDVITKHIGLIRKTVNKITSTIKKGILKVITTIILLIG